jgi:glycosyltransferase involved in cell wall biosynthesis
LTKVIQYSGFVEASAGIIQKGFAIREVANIKLSISEDKIPKILKISCFRTGEQWKRAKIGLKINSSTEFFFKTSKIGIKKTEIDLKNLIHGRSIELKFYVYPVGIKKFFGQFFAKFAGKKQDQLVRDTLLISEIYFDDIKILKYEDKNRFNYFSTESINKTKVRILGFFSQTFGLAEASRRTLKTIQCSKINVSATQIPYSGKHQNCEAKISCDKSLPKNENEIRLFHFNGDHLERLISDWGSSILDCKYKIGFWHWELPDFPEDYLQWFDLVDEVWVPSKFVFDSIAPKSSKPVQIIPLALDEQIIVPPSSDRKSFSIPDNKVVFLITFDFYSIIERKNPIAGIKAFAKLLEENIYNNDVHLVVKVSNHHADPTGYKFLENALSLINSENFSLINRVLPRIDMLQLMNSCDSLISLHRSEGFGLHLAEAMAMGKAVVATNWSGNTDFMNSTNSYPVEFKLVEIEEGYGPYRKGNVWAEPNLNHAVESLKQVIENQRNNPAEVYNKCKKSILKCLSQERISELIHKRITNIIYHDAQSYN